MTSSKLSESEKQEIIRLYQDVPEETTITLAERYGVSSSTVRRLLQSAVPKDVYDVLTQQKQRLHRTGKKSSFHTDDDDDDLSIQMSLPLEETEPEPPRFSEMNLPPRRRQRSSALAASDFQPESEQVSEPEPVSETYETEATGIDDFFSRELLSQEHGVFGDFEDEDEDEDEDDSEDEDDNEDEDDYLEEFSEDDEEGRSLFEHSLTRRGTALVKILPLTEASIPKTCYLVIDRSAELIAKPLKAFSELGQIPPEEIQEKTLPVFDNHRVASRFSGRNQRVFKVPDGRLLRKAAPYLQAKGITRLLIDGQVYRF